MANTYDEKVLKGKELEYYTRKLKTAIDAAKQEMAGDISDLTDRVDALESMKIELYPVDSKEYTEYYFDGTTYPTLEEAESARDAAIETAKATEEAKITEGTDPDTGDTYWTYEGTNYPSLEEATAAADKAAEESVPEITHSEEFDLYKDGEKVEPKQNKLYLVPAGSGDPATSTEQPNVCNEYVWTGDSYELVGSTDVALDELTEADIDNIWATAFNP